MVNKFVLTRLRRLAVSLALALSVTAPMAVPVSAQSLGANEAKTRINIAGRERMLIQRVVESACFATLGVERTRHRAALVEAEAQFEHALLALQNGDSDLGLSAESTPDLRASFEVISMEWSRVSSLADVAISPRGISVEGLESLDALGLDLLGKTNSAVQDITQTYGQNLDDLPLIVSISIDVAGRQRMLSQKMANEFCMIDAGVAPVAHRERLNASIRVFNATLAGLQSGLPGMVIPAPNYDIRRKLHEVVQLWQPVEAVLLSVANGTDITDEDRAIIVNNMDAVLYAMNDAVGMYEYVNAAP